MELLCCIILIIAAIFCCAIFVILPIITGCIVGWILSEAYNNSLKYPI